MIRRFNDWLAVNLTKVLLSIWCAYAFGVLCLLPLLLPKWEETILYVSNCFQLIFLPLLGVGQTLLGQDAALQAMEDHASIKEMHEEVMEELGDMRALVAQSEDFKCRHPKPAKAPAKRPKRKTRA